MAVRALARATQECSGRVRGLAKASSGEHPFERYSTLLNRATEGLSGAGEEGGDERA
jgi:hypothetical protein